MFPHKVRIYIVFGALLSVLVSIVALILMGHDSGTGFGIVAGMLSTLLPVFVDVLSDRRTRDAISEPPPPPPQAEREPTGGFATERPTARIRRLSAAPVVVEEASGEAETADADPVPRRSLTAEPAPRGEDGSRRDGPGEEE